MGRVYIGTSGWQYDSWREPFYHGETPRLEAYRKSFDSVEVNGTFYGLPKRESVEAWKAAAGEGFIFSVKASRYITHMKKLKDPEGPLDRFFGAVDFFGQSLGPILFQLPPKWRRNQDRLGSFLDALPSGRRYVFEFRDPDWYHPEVYSLLESAGAAFCLFHLAGHSPPREVTTDFVYIRLHGSEEAYRGSYSIEELSGWAGAVSSWSRAGLDVYVYFDNDQQAAAPRDALRLKEMLSGAE